MQNVEIEVVNSNIPNTPVKICPPGAPANKARRASELHMHDDIELLYITSGYFRMVSGDRCWKAQKGDVLFVNCRVVHETFIEEENTVSAMVQFNPTMFLRGDPSDFGTTLRRFLNVNDCAVCCFRAEEERTGELVSILNALITEQKEQRRAYEQYIQAEIYKLMAFLHRYEIITDNSRLEQNEPLRRLLPALHYIDTSYQEELTLEEISRTVNLNPSYFCRLFKKATGSTFTEYLNFVRVCRAELLLCSDSDSISEVSSEVGFSSVSYFNRIFKRYKGCTPSAYKKINYQPY